MEYCVLDMMKPLPSSLHLLPPEKDLHRKGKEVERELFGKKNEIN